jgi:glycosyltransferase involved in cell wall biosynthesis
MSYQDLVREAARRQTAGSTPTVVRRPPSREAAPPPPPAPRTPPPVDVSVALPSTRPSIVILGSMSAMPVGGVIWQTLHYIVGFQRIGYDVFYVETHGRYPREVMHRPGVDGTTLAVELIRSAMARVNMAGRWCYVDINHGERHHGMTKEELDLRYREADALINLHGGTVPLPQHTMTGRLVYLETDPVLIQAAVAAGSQSDVDFLALHNAHFSYGENYGAPDCRVPRSDRFNFIPTRQPIVLEYWPYAGVPSRPFTTVGNWNQYQDIQLDGETYTWSKRVEFMKFIDLPQRTPRAAFELALSQCGPDDVTLLRGHGWQVVDALEFSYDAEAYRSYIAGSRAEFTVAKDQNVRLRSGWFSDRSATYLASGRPVVTQDTGFGNILPTGAGLFPFTTTDEAVAAVELITADYEGQRQAARRIAEEWFDSDVVLGQLLRDLGLPVPGRRRVLHADR